MHNDHNEMILETNDGHHLRYDKRSGAYIWFEPSTANSGTMETYYEMTVYDLMEYVTDIPAWRIVHINYDFLHRVGVIQLIIEDEIPWWNVLMAEAYRRQSTEKRELPDVLVEFDDWPHLVYPQPGFADAVVTVGDTSAGDRVDVSRAGLRRYGRAGLTHPATTATPLRSTVV
jgi:hypothetical protein